MTEFAIELRESMAEMFRTMISRLEREEGQDMIEYALLAALISIVAIAIIILIGPYLQDLFADVINALNSA